MKFIVALVYEVAAETREEAIAKTICYIGSGNHYEDVTEMHVYPPSAYEGECGHEA